MPITVNKKKIPRPCVPCLPGDFNPACKPNGLDAREPYARWFAVVDSAKKMKLEEQRRARRLPGTKKNAAAAGDPSGEEEDAAHRCNSILVRGGYCKAAVGCRPMGNREFKTLKRG